MELDFSLSGITTLEVENDTERFKSWWKMELKLLESKSVVRIKRKKDKILKQVNK